MSLACDSGVNGCQKLAQKKFLNKTTPVIVLRYAVARVCLDGFCSRSPELKSCLKLR